MHRNFLTITLHQLERHWSGQSPVLRYISVLPSPIPKAFSEKETAHRSRSQDHCFGPCLPASCCKAASLVFLWNPQGQSPRAQEHRAESQVSEGFRNACCGALQQTAVSKRRANNTSQAGHTGVLQTQPRFHFFKCCGSALSQIYLR